MAAESGTAPAALMMGEKVIVPRLQATLPVAVTLPVSTTFPAPHWSNHTAGPAVSHMPGPGKPERDRRIPVAAGLVKRKVMALLHRECLLTGR